MKYVKLNFGPFIKYREVDGEKIICDGWLEFFKNGAIKCLALAKDQNIRGHLFQRESRLLGFLTPEGRLDLGFLPPGESHSFARESHGPFGWYGYTILSNT